MGADRAADPLGMNLRALREDKGMSQPELARLMNEAGHPWHQSTVYRVESGAQAAKFAEAVALGRIFGVNTDWFAMVPDDAAAVKAIGTSAAQVRLARDAVAEATEVLLETHREAAQILERFEASENKDIQEMRAALAANAGLYGLEEAVAEGVRRHEESSAGQEQADAAEDA